MEEQKDTKNIWIVMTITFFTVSIVFGILLYRSEKVIKEMQQTVAEKSVTVQEQQDVNASADSVRLMDGMVQVQKDNEWVDYCTIEEFAQSDPVEVGKQKMSDLIKSNQDAVNAGTLLEDVNSEFAMLEKAATREVIMEPQTEVSWKMETDNAKNTTNNPNKKKDNGKNQAGKGNTVSGQNAAETATPAETQPGADTSMQQPASGTSTGDNASSGGSPSGGGSSAGSSSSSGGGAPAGNTTPSGGNGSSNPSGGTAGTPSTGTDSGGSGASGGSAPDSGSSSGGSTDSGGGNSGSDSGNAGSESSGGDGEDIGWTDDIL